MFTILSVFFIYFVNYFFKKKHYLSNNTGQIHQKYSEKNYVPLTGGIYLLLFFIFNYYNDFFFLSFLTVIFIIGILTDLNIIESPYKRILIQIIFVFLFVYHFNLKVEDLRLDLINSLLVNDNFNIFFVSFCFLVLMNGSNFIDGNNGICIGYFLIIYFILNILVSNDIAIFDKAQISNIIIFLFILLIFNLFNFFYLGDSGVYLISIFTGYILIKFVNLNSNLSPYFIAALLWYPSLELLFSMIRKFKNRNSPMKPDVEHLHQLIFKNLKIRFNLPTNLINSLTGIIINSFNLVMLLISCTKPQSTDFQVFLILFNLSIYFSIYIYLRKLE